jgi:hypothetical protein
MILNDVFDNTKLKIQNFFIKLKNKGDTNNIKNRLKLERRPGMQIQSIFL